MDNARSLAKRVALGEGEIAKRPSHFVGPSPSAGDADFLLFSHSSPDATPRHSRLDRESHSRVLPRGGNDGRVAAAGGKTRETPGGSTLYYIIPSLRLLNDIALRINSAEVGTVFQLEEFAGMAGRLARCRIRKGCCYTWESGNQCILVRPNSWRWLLSFSCCCVIDGMIDYAAKLVSVSGRWRTYRSRGWPSRNLLCFFSTGSST